MLDDRDEFWSWEDEIAHRLTSWRQWAKNIELWCGSLERTIKIIALIACGILSAMSVMEIVKNAR